jgi:hypothetical protein
MKKDRHRAIEFIMWRGRIYPVFKAVRAHYRKMMKGI